MIAHGASERLSVRRDDCSVSNGAPLESLREREPHWTCDLPGYSLNKTPRIPHVHDEWQPACTRGETAGLVRHVWWARCDNRLVHAGLDQLARERGGVMRPVPPLCVVRP